MKIKTLRLFLIGAAICSCLSCFVPSLYPLFEDKDLVFEPALVGTWQGKDSADTWTFSKNGNEYQLISVQAKYKENPPAKGVAGETVTFQARLGRLGKFLFLDVTPDEWPENREVHNDLFNMHIIQAHTIWRVWLEKDLLRIASLNDEWLEKAIENGKVTIHHAQVSSKDPLILTAITAELQEFVMKYAEDREAFLLEEGSDLRRIK